MGYKHIAAHDIITHTEVEHFFLNANSFFYSQITTLYPPIALGFTDVTTEPGFGEVRGRATGFGSSSEMLLVLDVLGKGFGGIVCPPF